MKDTFGRFGINFNEMYNDTVFQKIFFQYSNDDHRLIDSNTMWIFFNNATHFLFKTHIMEEDQRIEQERTEPFVITTLIYGILGILATVVVPQTLKSLEILKFYKGRRIPRLDAVMIERSNYHLEFRNKEFEIDEFTPDFAINNTVKSVSKD